MKLKLFSVLALSGLIAAGVACGDSSSDSDGEGGSGGSGGDATGTTKTSTTATKTSSNASTTGSNNTTNSTGTGPMGCDTGEPGDYANNDEVCNDCITCTQMEDCANEWSAFASEPDAQAYIDCLTACPDGDTTCFQNCYDTYPEADEALLVALSCSVCSACATNCNAADNCTG